MAQRFLPAILALILLVAACGGSSDSGSSVETSEPTQATTPEAPLQLRLIATFTCNQTRGATAAVAAPLISEALSKAASAGFTGPELREAMRTACSDAMVTLEGDAEFSNLFEQ